MTTLLEARPGRSACAARLLRVLASAALIGMPLAAAAASPSAVTAPSPATAASAAPTRQEAADFVVQVLRSCTTREDPKGLRTVRETPLREVGLQGTQLRFAAGFFLVSVDLAGAGTRLVDDNGQAALEVLCKVPGCNVGRGNVSTGGDGEDGALWTRHHIRFVCGDEFNPRLKKALDFYIRQQPAPRSSF